MIPKPNINVLLANPTNTWSRNGQKIEYIVLHYVGAVSTARNNAEYLHRDSNLGWSAHYFVDETSIWQSVDLSLSAGHCGVDYSNGRAPFWGKCRCKNSIGIEMCCKKDKNGAWFIEPKTVERTIPLVKWLMAEYNIPLDRVIRHYDVCWKCCPAPWVINPNQWYDFKKRLAQPEQKEDEEDMQRFKTVAELPAWAREDIQKLIDKGYLEGKGGEVGLDLTEDMARTLIVCGRMQGVL